MTFIKKIDYFITQNIKIISIFLIILAILLQTHVRYTNNRMGSDQLLQISSANSFIHGHGFSIANASVKDLSKTNYKALTSFPYGYGLLMSPLLIITNNNYELSELILAFFGLILLFVFLYKLLLILSNYTNKYLIPLIFLFWAFTYTPFRHLGVPDILSLSLYVTTIYYSSKLILSFDDFKNKKKYLYAVVIGIIAFLCSFVRYAYYPLTLLIPLTFIGITIFYNKKFWKIASIITIVTVGLVLLQIFSTTYTQETSEMMVTGVLHLKGLLLCTGIFSNAFFADNIIFNFFLKYTGAINIPIWLFTIYSIISLLIFIFLVIGIIQIIRKYFNSIFKTKKINPLPLIIIFSSITILTTLLFYIFLYIQKDINLEEFFNKNYLYKYMAIVSRYYAPIFLFTQICTFLFITLKPNIINNKIKSFFSLIIILAFIYNLSHWAYLRTKFSIYDRQVNMELMNNPKSSINDFNKLQVIFKKNKIPIVYVFNNEEQKRNFRQLNTIYYAMANGIPILNFSNMKNTDLYSSKPIDLMISVYKTNPNKNRLYFCKKNKAKKILSLNNIDMDIYCIKIKPEE